MKLPLKFDTTGNFKIVQFTDLHEGPVIDKTITDMNKTLDYEKPNLVLLTGDIIDGACKTVNNIKNTLRTVAEPMESRKIPWAIVFGNHDDEHELMSKKDMMKLYMSYPYNISGVGFKTFDRIGNYNILINSSKSSSPAFNIYMMDSGKYAPESIGGYDWIKWTQILWYRWTTFKLKIKYKKLLPSLMFFHIPLPEFKAAWENGDKEGIRLEEECSPKKNTHLFKVLVKTGNVTGVFVGHDHLNNYSAVLDGIKLGYGNYTGYGSYGSDNLPRGARVFLINENDPANFKTWLRKANDKELNPRLTLSS